MINWGGCKERCTGML